MHLPTLSVLLAASASVVSAQATVPGLGCVCMAPTASGRDQSIADRTTRCCRDNRGTMINTVNFWNRGNFYCRVPNSVTPADWDQNCCRKWYGSGTYGFCNQST
ncbi:hypothetical protein GGP41_005456 [Bipolaris sorokiniana]|uniref:Uncharacterized protein n=1 Tax=Cochliobolus sativus TaxID=45130 RepID=A0A8H5ZIV6_COCSA|nr:hypothetical protein GGP41_005456 [Bipolaris sorokiniana]